jgi:hypothetical protein
MEARLPRAALWAAVLSLAACVPAVGATYQSDNFVVEAASDDIARQVGEEAERFRRELAIQWLGQALPKWSRPCPIVVKVGPNLGAGGATSFMFDHGEVFGWQMNIQGSLERVLDSVLPHEVTHTIFASHFRQPLPRWADEGACTTVEHPSERAKQQRMLIQFLQTGRGIAFSQMFAMRDYPRDVMPLYSQGHSLVTFLLHRGGPDRFMAYVGDGLKSDRWVETTRKHYGFASLAELQNTWLDWVREGSPEPDAPAASLVATEPRSRPEPNLIYRGQNATSGDALASASGGNTNSELASSKATAAGASGAAGSPASTRLAQIDVPAPVEDRSALMRQRMKNAIQKGLTPFRDWRPVPGKAARPEGEAQRVASASSATDPFAATAAERSARSEQANGGEAPSTGAAETQPSPQRRSRQVILEWSRAKDGDGQPGAGDTATAVRDPAERGTLVR